MIYNIKKKKKREKEIKTDFGDKWWDTKTTFLNNEFLSTERKRLLLQVLKNCQHFMFASIKNISIFNIYI